MLLTLTGHRPVRDPFCRRSDISLTHCCAIVEDKVVSERHRFRFAWLCLTARDQIAAYDAHRRNLASHLAGIGTSQAASLAAALAASDGRDTGLPYLFLLHGATLGTLSVTPKRLNEATADTWARPLNLGRHLIATRLRRFGVAEAWISATLNHLDSPVHPFGPTSLLVPHDCGQVMRAALQSLSDELGWTVLEGLPPAPLAERIPARTDSPTPIHESPLLGPDWRERVRHRRREQDMGAVRAAIGPDGLNMARGDPARIDRWCELLVRGAKGNAARAGRRVALLWRYLRRHGGPKLLRHLPRRIAAPEPEPSPFGRDALERLHSGHRLVRAFSDRLTARAGEGRAVDVAERVAELCLYAAIWGGVVDARRLAGLAAVLPKGAYATAGIVWVEIPRADDPRPAWRWYPDAMGRALLQGLRRAVARRDRAPGPDLVAKRLTVWIESYVTADRGVSGAGVYERIAWAASGLWTQYAPALARDIACGTLPNQPLPLSAVVRMLTRRRLAPGAQTAANPEVTPVTMPPSAPASGDRGPDDFRRALQEAIASAQKVDPKGTERRSTSTRARLAEALRLLGESRWPPVAAMVLAWGIHLCERGTRRKRRLAGGTPVDYLRTVVTPLCESGWFDDWLEADDRELEETYARALSYDTRSDKGAYLAGRLEELQAFASAYLGVADVDPSVFAPVDSAHRPETRLPDAGILWPWEYERILDLIDALEDASVAQRHAIAAVMILGYRFGLRRGEVRDLLAVDLWVGEGDDCYVHVHASVYGDRKSPAATRTVPLIGRLSSREREALQALAARGRVLSAADAHAPLFAVSSSHGRERETYDAFKIAGMAMRQVTGDPGTRYHHSRHSFANRVFATVIGRSGEDAWNVVHEALALPGITAEQARLLLTGEEALSSTTLHALAVVLGHTDVRTTFAHYVHVADAWLPASLDLRTWP